MNLLQNLLSESFVPHGHCYLWKPELVWLNVVADSVIFLAYFSIPLQLLYIVKKRGDLPFNWIFCLFGSFILACGTGHLLDVWTLWHPTYWLSSSVKAITAIVSIGTTFTLITLIPKILLLPSTNELKQAKETAETALANFQQTQNHLIQFEKMSSLGQLVAGVAHEINNPVNFIYGNINHIKSYAQELIDVVNLYQSHYPEPVAAIDDRLEEIDLDFITSDLPKVLSSMQIGADRIRQIVLSLRNFSRLDQAEMKVVDIHEGIDNTLLILQNRLKGNGEHPDIQVIKQYGKLPAIECYSGQLNQVFMNILGNALDALEERIQSAALSIQNAESQAQSSISNSQIPSPTIQIHTETLNSEKILIVIKDNGDGIPESVRSRLFDPFFTTKPIGKGTGLGLSISYQIVVDKHHGSITCLSEPGKGTEFHIQLPIRSKPLTTTTSQVLVQQCQTATNCAHTVH
ncbi:MAG: ATP-binding protein [Leptolyngbyaceae cyanobacterium bins.302]|nr:ATP-binding protein [Leptolyngbyaceae cyanobacterium bins.302]